MDRMAVPVPTAARPRRAPSRDLVQMMLITTMVALGAAALMHTAVYGLLLLNRTRLLYPVVAGTAVWLSRIAGAAALVAVVGCAVVLTGWLVARRSAAFTRRRLPETRSRLSLWLGCLVPLVNLFWAPVYVIELAALEGRSVRLGKPIRVWWLLWAASMVLSIFATATRWAQNAQAIGNNAELMVLSYLLALATVAATARVVEDFDRSPVDRPAHHWVIVAAGEPDSPESAKAADALESGDQEPAA